MPYTGATHKLNDEDTTMRWFTGQSYKLAPMPSQTSPAKEEGIASKRIAPRWADMVDDEEGSELEEVTNKGSDEQLTGLEPPIQLATSPLREHRAVRNQRRQKRNQELLKQKSKTQMCRHLTEDGHCKFGDACWFAHSEFELMGPKSMDKETLNGSISILEAKDQDVATLSESTVRNANRKAKNKDLLKRNNKTQMCRYLSDQGHCPFSAACWFAHSTEELCANAVGNPNGSASLELLAR